MTILRFAKLLVILTPFALTIGAMYWALFGPPFVPYSEPALVIVYALITFFSMIIAAHTFDHY